MNKKELKKSLRHQMVKTYMVLAVAFIIYIILIMTLYSTLKNSLENDVTAYILLGFSLIYLFVFLNKADAISKKLNIKKSIEIDELKRKLMNTKK